MLAMIDPLLDFIKSKLKKLKKHILYHFMRYTLTSICTNTLSIDPGFTIEEIRVIYKNDHYQNFLELTKNIIILWLIGD